MGILQESNVRVKCSLSSQRPQSHGRPLPQRELNVLSLFALIYRHLKAMHTEEWNLGSPTFS